MFTLRAIFIYCLAVALCLLHTSNAASYTSEETDEKSKSLYSAVTSILGSTDTSKHHHKHTYNDSPPPCLNSAYCPTNIPTNEASSPGMLRGPSSCPGPSGCQTVNPSPHSGHPQSGYVSGAYGTQYPTNPNYISVPNQAGAGSYSNNHPSYPSSVPVARLPQGGYVGGTYEGSAPFQPSSQSVYGYNGYPVRQPSAPYGQVNGHGGPYGYQGERGYSILDHSLKTNSEYTEVGTHNGPLQHAPNGYGYGSGYGGYMGMYNRPGF